MDCLTKKIVKKTNPNQFRALVDSMDEFPELATSSPIFGKTKAENESKWDIVAYRVNAVGPPIRNGADWKKIWADIKCRTKGKIAENNKNMNGTGGGPSCITMLTEIENDIDRICQLSAAAAPTGNTFGGSLGPKTKKPIVLEATPPRRTNNVAVVTPTTPGQSQAHHHAILLSPIKSTPTPNTPTIYLSTLNTSTSLTTNYRKSVPTKTSTQRKRKCTDSNVEEAEQIKLLRLQVEQNGALVDEMRAQTRNLNSMAESLQGIENVMREIISFLKDE